MEMLKRCVGFLTLVVLALLAGCAPRPEPTSTVGPPLTATDTPVPTDTPMPTVTPQPVQGYELTAWLALGQPKMDEIQTVHAQLTQGGEGVAGASMYVVAHYQSGDRRYPAQGYEASGDDGMASVSFAVYDAGAEYPVSLDVYLLYDEVTLQEALSYTPTC